MARQIINNSPGTADSLKVGADKINAMTDELYVADAAAGTASLRTIGTGAQQACAGNDSRLTNTRTPTDGSVTNAKVAADAAIAESKLNLASDAAAGTPSRRTLGTGAQQACAGNDARLSDTRTPTNGSVTSASLSSTLLTAFNNKLTRTETGGAALEFGAVPDLTLLFRDGTTIIGRDFAAVAEYTMATRPAAAPENRGCHILVTGIGNVEFVEMVSTGSKWIPAGGSQLLYNWTSSAAVTTSGSTPEVNVTARVMTIPGGLGNSTSLFIHRSQARWPAVDGANAYRIFNGTSATPFFISAASQKTIAPEVRFWNKGSVSAQRRGGAGNGGTGLGNNNNTSTTYDADLTINMAADWAITSSLTGVAATSAEVEMAQLMWVDA